MSVSVVMLTEATVTETDMTSFWTVDNLNQSKSSVPENCVILGVNTTIPWDNPHNLISLEAEYLFDKIKSAILIPVLFLIGFPANCINMAVFFKQGLKERINLCLFSLALIDIICLAVVLIFHAERIYTRFTGGDRFGAFYRYMMNNNVIGLYGFIYGPMFLSAIISTERCICVLFPMRAQRCIPTKAIAVIIVVGVLAMSFAQFAITAMYQVTCYYEIHTQRLSWHADVNEYYFRNEAMINALNGLFFGFCLTVGCPVIVLIGTIITAMRLIQTVRWRSQTSSALSSKEIGVTKMLIALSIEFFVLSIPLIVLRVFPVFEPRFNAGGNFANSYDLLVGLAELFSNMSSSVNFFVYYFFGTKYRETLNGLLNWKTTSNRKKNSHFGSIATVTHSLTYVDQADSLGIEHSK